MKINKKLKEILKIKNGQPYEILGNGNIPLYGSGGLMGFVNKSLFNDESVLLPRKGTLDNIMYVSHPFWTVDTMYWTEIDKNTIDPFYLYNYLKLLDLSPLRSGSTLPSMTFDAYYNIDLMIHNLPYQKEISRLLKSFYRKIELNNQIISKLESLTKLIYEYWFIQFDFPDENGRPYKSSGGKMAWNEKLKREIPEGWEVRSLKEISKMYQPQTIPQKDLSDDYEFPVYGAGGIIGRYHKTNHDKPMLIISCRGNCGDVDITLPNSWITGNQMVIDACNNFKYYIHGYLCVINTDGLITGSVQDQITQTSLGNLYIPMPIDNLIKKFNVIAENSLLKKQGLLLEKEELIRQRDFLLPLLINGQVTIK